MKVLKVKETERVCKHCGSTLLVSVKDIKLKDFGDLDYSYYFKCPVCKEDNYVENRRS